MNALGVLLDMLDLQKYQLWQLYPFSSGLKMFIFLSGEETQTLLAQDDWKIKYVLLLY